jgi:hypothetical protein
LHEYLDGGPYKDPYSAYSFSIPDGKPAITTVLAPVHKNKYIEFILEELLFSETDTTVMIEVVKGKCHH